jgi:hypothetical protein
MDAFVPTKNARRSPAGLFSLGTDMRLTYFGDMRRIARAMILLLAIPAFGAIENKTFVITVSLPSATVHADDLLVIEETVSNPTDHVVFLGDGPGVGSTVELLNEKGTDIGRHAMGASPKPNDDAPVIHGNRVAIGPGTSSKAVWRYKPEPGYLVPGIYKLRTHIRDMASKAEIYSNVVTLSVLP